MTYGWLGLVLVGLIVGVVVHVVPVGGTLGRLLNAVAIVLVLVGLLLLVLGLVGVLA